MSIELTDEEYKEIEESIEYISDASYAYRIAEIISKAMKRKHEK